MSCPFDDGKICHVWGPGADRFDSRTDLYYHLICMRCGTVVDVPMDYQENTDLTTTEKNGYWIDRHRMVVEGICLDYQKEETDR